MTEELIFAKTMGISTEDFWDMTPFELHIENQAFEMKFKREHILDLQLLNVALSFGGAKSVNYDDILGYQQMKDFNLKNITNFNKDGNFQKEEWEKYLKDVVIPIRVKLGMEV
jgi:hypothetical protein